MSRGTVMLLSGLCLLHAVSGGFLLTSRAGSNEILPIASAVKIDNILSNYWNNTYFLSQTHPNITFFTGGNYTDVSINSTSSTPDIVGIKVEENRKFQAMLGYGAGVTDSTAIVLQDLKTTHREAYDEILNLAFSDSPDWTKKGGAAMNMVRVPIGASDFGYTEYTYCDTQDGSDDVDLKQFNIDKSPKRWALLQDITALRPELVIVATPWSPPAWMKGYENGSLHGGSLLEKYEVAFADYLVRFVKDLDKKKNLQVSVLSLQNEPLYDGAPYPCMKMEPPQQARVGKIVRKKLDAAGFRKVGLLAYDHNWDQAQYPIDVLDAADEDTFMGAAWHCYGGDPAGQKPFNEAYPTKQVWFTECTRITQFFEEPWINIRKQFRDLITGSINYNAMTTILWNLALIVTEEGYTRPSLPKTCRNCLAPFLILANATDGSPTDGVNMNTIKASEGGKRRSQGGLTSSARTVQNTLGVVPKYAKLSPGPNEGADANAIVPTGKPMNTNPVAKMNRGAVNEDEVIPPTREQYYRTSDFTTLAHLGLATRPEQRGGTWARRVGVVTSEDGSADPRVYTQLFEKDLGNQNDHQGYNYGSFEDMTFQIKFRDAVAQVILPPGAFTLQWTAKNP
ncbi:hypothetical protein CBS101457_004567 [Exobasidium rhododendri]|nr:hypothetical protein CBS101457_004567 [Exobasidium rhododendri]